MIRRKAAPVVVALLVLLFVPTPAMAGHGEQGSAGDPDNGDHYVDRNNLTSNGDAAAQWGVWALNSSADMVATFDGTGDVEIYDHTYGDTGWAGLTDCVSGYNWLTGDCDIFSVKFNQSAMAGLNVEYWRSLGCHELGHTAGLGHRYASTDSNDNSCMRSNIWPRLFDSHDIDEIDSTV